MRTLGIQKSFHRNRLQWVVEHFLIASVALVFLCHILCSVYIAFLQLAFNLESC